MTIKQILNMFPDLEYVRKETRKSGGTRLYRMVNGELRPLVEYAYSDGFRIKNSNIVSHTGLHNKLEDNLYIDYFRDMVSLCKLITNPLYIALRGET